MNKWMMIILLAVSMMACNRQAALNSNKSDKGKAGEEMTKKSGDVVLNAPPLKTYGDLKQTDEGTALSERELANKICFCSYELTRMNEDIQRYHRNNDKNSLLRVKSKVDGAFSKFDKCMAKIKADYPKAVAENDPQDVFGEVEKQCPGVITIMEAGNQALKEKASSK